MSYILIVKTTKRIFHKKISIYSRLLMQIYQLLLLLELQKCLRGYVQEISRIHTIIIIIIIIITYNNIVEEVAVNKYLPIFLGCFFGILWIFHKDQQEGFA